MEIPGQISAEIDKQELDGLDPAEANRLGEVGLDLIAAALASGVPAADLADRTVRTARLVKIKLLINEKLPDPRLSPAMVATALGISVRYLNALFSSEPLSVERWIWERRLQRCHAALQDPSQQGRSISDIAYGWGFSEMSHFSRTFKQRFCLSPREMRRQAANQRPAGELRRVRVKHCEG
jgi:AraC family transcriptional regulator, positive regulator of tynA and feaB